MTVYPGTLVYSRSKESTKRSSIWESLWSLITLLKEARWTWSSSPRPTRMSAVPQIRWRLLLSIKKTKIMSWWRVSASHHLGLASHLLLKGRRPWSKLIKKEWMSQVSRTFTRSKDSWQEWSLTWSRRRLIWNSRSSNWKRSLHLKKRRYPMRHCRNRDIWLRICNLNRKLGRSRRRSKSFKCRIKRQKSVFRVCFVTWIERRSKSKSWSRKLRTWNLRQWARASSYLTCARNLKKVVKRRVEIWHLKLTTIFVIKKIQNFDKKFKLFKMGEMSLQAVFLPQKLNCKNWIRAFKR